MKSYEANKPAARVRHKWTIPEYHVVDSTFVMDTWIFRLQRLAILAAGLEVCRIGRT